MLSSDYLGLVYSTAALMRCKYPRILGSHARWSQICTAYMRGKSAKILELEAGKSLANDATH